jgi:uncharacterized phage protein (TIGR01671 family)
MKEDFFKRGDDCMRTVEYRVWDLVEEKMMYENDIDNYCVNTGEDGYFHVLKVGRFVPQQYTGLKDRNGKKIYEGDIIQFSKNSNSIWKAYFNTELGFWGVENVGKDYGVSLSELYQWGHWEVIGNIYNNPELIKV